MGDVDLADQLRGTYRLDVGVRNRKWWWSLIFWDFGVMLVNLYVVYCAVQLANGTPTRDWISHHDFRRDIALYWINPKMYRKENNTIVVESAGRRRNSEGKPRPRKLAMTSRSDASPSSETARPSPLAKWRA